MTKIIVSYRRSDSSASAGRIFDRLTSRYGDDSVFMDVDNIPFGIDFRTHIQSELLKSDILVAVIGPRWFGATADGQHRISEETDPVRVEVETALRNGVPVLPVLVDGAAMPGANQLPEALKALSFINAAPVDMGRDFRQHMDRLIRSMDGILASRAGQLPSKGQAPSKGQVPSNPGSEASGTTGTSAAPPPKIAFGRPLMFGAAALVLIAGAGFFLLPRSATVSSSQPPPNLAETSGSPVVPKPQPIPAAEPLPERPPVIAARPRMPEDSPAPAAGPAAAPPPVPGTGSAKTYRVLPSVSEGKLNMRGGPGTKYPLVASIPAGATGVTIAGRCRMPDDGGTKPWCEAKWQASSGWVSSCCVVDEKTGAFPQ